MTPFIISGAWASGDGPAALARAGTHRTPGAGLIATLVGKHPAVAGLAGILVGPVRLQVEVDQGAARVVIPAPGELV